MAGKALIETEQQDRVKSALAVGAAHALIGYALITGLGIDVPGAVDERLKLFAVSEAPPPPPIEPAVPARAETAEPAERIKPAPKDPEGAAAPPNLKASPTQIVAPEPEIRLPVPPPITAAPVAGPGSEASAGASTRPGPGTGAGGQGQGLGSGAYGSGTGGGGGAGVARGPRLISANVRDSDYPRSAIDRQGTVYMRFLVTPQGRIGRCEVTRSSGHAGMDRETCLVMQKRLRYRPARDAYGRPVPAWTEGEQEWFIRQAPDRWVEPDVPEDQ